MPKPIRTEQKTKMRSFLVLIPTLKGQKALPVLTKSLHSFPVSSQVESKEAAERPRDPWEIKTHPKCSPLEVARWRIFRFEI